MKKFSEVKSPRKLLFTGMLEINATDSVICDN